jgi:hypothetical protein
MLAFEPFSCAVAACAIEHILCCNRPRSLIPRARVWIRRNSEIVLDALAQEAAEPLLDSMNRINAGALVGAIALLVIVRSVFVLAALYRSRMP